jgi:transcriptional regulator with XRE-family HTH domain
MAKRHKQVQPRSGVEKAFGQLIRQIRKQLGISQAELEKRTGLDRTFISDLERGIQGPGIRTLFRIAKGLETPAWDLIHHTAKSPLFVFPRGKETS